MDCPLGLNRWALKLKRTKRLSVKVLGHVSTSTFEPPTLSRMVVYICLKNSSFYNLINHFLSMDVEDEESKLVEYNFIEDVLGRFGLAEDFRLLESRFFTDSVIDLASSSFLVCKTV